MRDTVAEARTGRLGFAELAPARGGIRRGLHFEAGHLTLASSSATAERLGETLVRSGRLGLFDLVRATTVVARDHKRLGQVLRELGLLDPDRLRDGLALQARDQLARVLRAPGLGWEWIPADAMGEPTLPTASVFQDAVRAVADAAAVRYALGGPERILRRAIPPRILSSAALDPLQQELQRKLDLAPVSPRTLVTRVAADALAVERALVGLLCLGHIA